MHYCLLTDPIDKEKIICFQTVEERDCYCQNNANAEPIPGILISQFVKSQFENLPKDVDKYSKKSEVTPEKIVETFLEIGVVKNVADKLGVWHGTVLKCLVSRRIYPNVRSLHANEMVADGLSKDEICKKLKISHKTYETYMPYTKGSYLSPDKTLNALKIAKSRREPKERKKLTRKVINGKLYDTATAKKLAEWDENGADSINYISEALYRKKTGEFFVFGDGGANTKYARISRSKSFEPGSEIIPLSLAQAKAWASDHLSHHEYDDIFGDIIVDDGSTTVTSFRLSSAMLEAVRRCAQEKGESISEFICAAIREAIK